MSGRAGTVDARELGGLLRRGWRWIAVGAAVGLALAAVLTVVVRPSYRGRATLLLRNATAMPGVGLGMSKDGISPLGIASALAAGTAFDTEMELLTSRSVLGSVADSLLLQAEVVEPTGTAANAVFAAAAFPRKLEKATYRFTREGGGYVVRGPGADGVRATPGIPVDLGGARVTLRRGGLPERFSVRLVDRDRVVDRLVKDLSAKRAGGEVAELRYSAYDPATAAAVPNAVVAKYLERRKTTDRGVNEHRYEFLVAHTDSIGAALADAEGRLRAYQEASGVADPTFTGSREVEQAIKLRGDLEQLQVEGNALREILRGRELSSGELAAYPTFLRNGAVNAILSRLLDLRMRRADLLERRTPRDPDVVTLDRSIAQTEGELATVSRDYYSGLSRQEAEMQRQLAGYRQTLAAIPRDVQETARLQREVRRLSETLVALQTQGLQTRLAAIGEGGEVHEVDVATPPLRPEFPIPLLNIALGLFGGAFFGAIGLMIASQTGQRLHTPLEAELASGLPAAALRPGAPLLLGGIEGWRTVLVLPAGPGGDSVSVAAALARTAALRGETVVVVDPSRAPEVPASGTGRAAPGTALAVPAVEGLGTALTPMPSSGGDGYLAWYAGDAAEPVPATLRTGLGKLEQHFARVIVALPAVDSPAAVALLAEGRCAVLATRAGRVRRDDVEQTAAAARRMGVAVLGLVMEEPSRRRTAAA
ncbi:MAG: lipopolysaccharide biosynthesis protein [Gemmatimonadetes bacterium]|nr:lipopolysaccharide biosynthesis protein [Gemmatimonadota bacterium]